MLARPVTRWNCQTLRPVSLPIAGWRLSSRCTDGGQLKLVRASQPPAIFPPHLLCISFFNTVKLNLYIIVNTVCCRQKKILFIFLILFHSKFNLTVQQDLVRNVPNYMKSVPWCRLKGAHNWIGGTVGGRKMGWGGNGKGEVSLQATWDQGGQGSHHTKRRVSK